MAVTFQLNTDGSPEITIGGGSGTGGTGPYPRYSISRQETYSADNTWLGSVYNITISGTATINVNDNTSAVLKGGRYSSLQGEDIIRLQTGKLNYPILGEGKLNLGTLAGGEGIVFEDARLLSVDIPQKSEDSSISSSEYSFTFEAYCYKGDTKPLYLVREVSETWNLQEKSRFCFPNDDIMLSAYKVYTLSHTVSATGLKRYNGTSLEVDGESWMQAVRWVESRLVENPTRALSISHINGKGDLPKFVPFAMNSFNNRNDLKLNALGSLAYKSYNPTRNIETDQTDGSYSVTDSWIIALESSTVMHQVSTEVQSNSEASATVISVNGTIYGLNTNNINSSQDDLFQKASSGYTALLSSGKIFQYAQSIYNNLSKFVKISGKTLRNLPLSSSMGENRNTGEITWSVSYDDEQILCGATDVAKESVSINYGNLNRSTNPIAIIPVIGKANGPVVQTFPTNNIRTVSVQIDLIMKPGYTNDPESLAESVALLYRPQSGLVSSSSSNWDAKSRIFSLSVEWMYK